MDTASIVVFVVTVLVSIAILLLLSLGLAIIFGMRGIINLAHGEFVMLGAFAALRLTVQHVPFALSVPIAAVAVGVFGLLVERLLIRRLYDRLLDCMLATWGLGLILVQVITLRYGTTPAGLSIPLGHLSVGRYDVAIYGLLLIVMAVVALGTVFVVMRRTRFGTVARATARSTLMAEALGVDTSRVDMLTFAAGAAAAGFAGALLAPFLGVSPTMGQGFIAQVFMTVIVGGADFILGAAGAAGLLGGVRSSLSQWFSPVIGQVGLLLVAIVIIRLRPQGLTRAPVRQ